MALLRTFFADFLRLFFAQWGRVSICRRWNGLARSWPGGAPQAPLHSADMVAKIAARHPVAEMHDAESPPWLVPVHLDIESADQTMRIKPRLTESFYHLRAAHGLPGLPIVT
jgi:hypothetical protein